MLGTRYVTVEMVVEDRVFWSTVTMFEPPWTARLKPLAICVTAP